MTRQEWAFAELDLRRDEQAQPDTSDMRVARRKRRQARGYTKKTADDLVSWAEGIDRKAAA